MASGDAVTKRRAPRKGGPIVRRPDTVQRCVDTPGPTVTTRAWVPSP